MLSVASSFRGTVCGGVGRAAFAARFSVVRGAAGRGVHPADGIQLVQLFSSRFEHHAAATVVGRISGQRHHRVGLSRPRRRSLPSQPFPLSLAAGAPLGVGAAATVGRHAHAVRLIDVHRLDRSPGRGGRPRRFRITVPDGGLAERQDHLHGKLGGAGSFPLRRLRRRRRRVHNVNRVFGGLGGGRDRRRRRRGRRSCGHGRNQLTGVRRQPQETRHDNHRLHLFVAFTLRRRRATVLFRRRRRALPPHSVPFIV